jgi:hypothetical protein
MSTTYLQAVNSVLRRLRETEVSSVSDNTYSKLIGEFVNDSKRLVEDAFNWSALNNAITVTTSSGVSNYTVTGSGQRFRVSDVIDTSNGAFLSAESTNKMDQYYTINVGSVGHPLYYNFKGVDSNGDAKVNLYPVPDDVYSLTFNLYIPQDSLSSDSTVILVPSEPIIFGAVARAIAERGEDGGIASSEMFMIYRQSLSDAIALESGRYSEESAWDAY